MPEATISYRVVRNAEEQHSILPAGVPLPKGWTATGFTGDRAACLAHLDATWTDLRPLSLRRSAS